MKTFEHEWIFEPFAGHRTFFTKRMFGGLAAYCFERQMLVLVEPTKSGRWKWHGVLVCTSREHHASIRAEFPALEPHDVLGKWLFIDSRHDDFESTMEAVAKRIARDDPRFGILPAKSEETETEGARPYVARPYVVSAFRRTAVRERTWLDKIPRALRALR